MLFYNVKILFFQFARSSHLILPLLQIFWIFVENPIIFRTIFYGSSTGNRVFQKYQISYMAWIVVQREQWKLTVHDFCAHAYCTYDVIKQVYEGVVVAGLVNVQFLV